MPLLQECFYDDWARIMLVLNDNGFVTKTEVKDGLFKKSDLVDTDRLIYGLIRADRDEWNNSERYKKIYPTTKQTYLDENNE